MTVPAPRPASEPLAWPAAAVILVLIVLSESMPLLLGAGGHAVVDWGLAYVSVHFVLLPALCAVHIVMNLLMALRFRTRRLTQLCSVLVSGGYLIWLYFKPVPWTLGH